MKLHKNTVVFLDTGFFSNFRSDKEDYKELLEYSKRGLIVMCTSFLSIAEWRSQKIKHYLKLQDTIKNESTHHRKSNPVSSEIFDMYPITFPEPREVFEISQKVLLEFIESNKIIIFRPKYEHIDRTWEAYFAGSPPFKEVKNRTDIPDSWIYEAGKDLFEDSRFNDLENKYCIGSDEKMIKDLINLGFTEAKPSELVKKLREEEETPIQEKNSKSPIDTQYIGSKDQISHNNLEEVLTYAASPKLREIYLRVLGYVYWLDKPSKTDLIYFISQNGFEKDLIRSVAVILNAINLIEDTGNYYLSKNKSIGEEAANKIEDEILDLLNNN